MIQTMPLSTGTTGQHLRIGAIQSENANDMLRLQELGFLEGTEVQILKSSDPMVLRVGETRLGIQRDLASQISAYRLK
ncbi:MAG: ferrous iron transport protein A [Gemmatimonadetes bacterium]|nr:MAG: ferrous iron transport protein A [Gemmatimonadota bacterium]